VFLFCYNWTVIRSYSDSDYEQLKELYSHTEWYGGIFDEARDGRKRLSKVIEKDPQAILVYEESSSITGTVSIIEDGRVAMLFRFVTAPEDIEIAKQLYDESVRVLKKRGHNQILVYSAIKSLELDKRYLDLGMNKGGDYTCFWADI
jgi:hypothetical protein